MEHRVVVGGKVAFGNDLPIAIIAGPCQLESEDLCIEVATKMQRWCDLLGLGYVFKGSFDKANRTSKHSERGPGIIRGAFLLNRVREVVGCPVTTDVHEVRDVKYLMDQKAVDMIQIPALLSRQTDLIQAAGDTGLPVNIKKYQGMAPADIRFAALKAQRGGRGQVMLTERGTTFGYGDLVSDMRGLQIMKDEGGGWPVIMDASHAAQKPSANGATSGGDRSMIPVLARAAVAVGVAGVFIECHPDPDHAMSDGPTSMRLSDMPALMAVLTAIDDVVKQRYA